MAGCDFHEEVKETVHDHEVRIRALEVTGAKETEQNQGLCQKIDALITAIKWLIAAGASALGSLYWYVLTLPKVPT